MPTVEMSCSRDCDIAKDRGREPARKELGCFSIEERLCRDRREVRNGHDGTQREQHEEPVQHVCRALSWVETALKISSWSSKLVLPSASRSSSPDCWQSSFVVAAQGFASIYAHRS